MRTIIRTLKELKEMPLNTDWSVFSFDTETTSLKYLDLEIQGMSFCDGIDTFYIDLIENPETGSLLQYIDKMLFSRARRIIAHNIVFDLKVLHKYNIHPKCDLFCTLVADHLIDENRRSHGLKELAKEILGVDVVKFEDVENHQSQQFYDYAMNDSEWAWQIYEMHRKSLKELSMEDLFYNIEMPFQWCLLEMELTGVLIDKERVESTRIELEKKILDLQNQMDTILGHSGVNYNSTKQLAQVLFVERGLAARGLTKTGNPSTDAEVIEYYKDKDDFVKVLALYKIASKLLSGFFKKMGDFIEEDGRIRPSFRDTGTVTGRLSCSKPNLQQLPKMNKEFPVDTRACFIVPEGKKMISCDYSGQEVRVMAQVSKDPTLIDSILKGQDMHLKIANQFSDLGIPEECLYSSHPKYEDYKEKYKVERHRAKMITFGLCYGKSAHGFAQDFQISEDEAQKIINKYFAKMPLLKRAINETHRELEERGFVVSLFGRIRRFEKVRGYNGMEYPPTAYRQSFNFLIQGASADMIRLAAINTYKFSKDNPHYGLKLIMTIHDECVYEVDENYAGDAAFKISQCFENAVSGFVVPMKSDASIGNNYGEAK